MALTPDERLDALESRVEDHGAELAELVRLSASDARVNALAELVDQLSARLRTLEDHVDGRRPA